MARSSLVSSCVVFCLSLATTTSGAIVPKPGFENYTALPIQISQLSLATPWYTPTAASPDYFHTSGTGTAAVPNNLWGSQSPYEGEAYAGVISYNSATEEREYLQAPLDAPLIQGEQYSVTFYVSLADDSGWAIDGMGALFTNGAVGHGGYGPINATPQVANPANNILSNTTDAS